MTEKQLAMAQIWYAEITSLSPNVFT